MSFTNLSIDWGDLPASQAVIFKPIHITYLKVLRITWGIFYGSLFIALAALFIFVDELHSIQLILSVFFGLLLLVLATVIIGTESFKRKGFAIREKDIIYKSGWLFNHINIVPFSRIQHCVVHIGPIERKFGLASIGIYTAAASVQDVFIKGLSNGEAEQLKDFILGQMQKQILHD